MQLYYMKACWVGPLQLFLHQPCLFAWGIFALINLYALARILSGVEHIYEYNL
ncbi:hypothetical protein [Commensalibacter sp. ESL0382]|uniref:hypothetical protein n=1 Tax=Commensalibacter sp. ESL0382 TaxID=2676445 RepID=UPI001E3EAE32|nr:hypothetical protein [Commensalibacter sp. ESL0382]